MTAPDDLAMPFLLMSAFRGLVEAVHAELDEAGFPGIQVRHGFAMQAIGAGCTSVELGQRLGVTKQAAAKTVASLEVLGLVTRVPDPADRRALTVVPTERGARMLAESAAAFRRHLQEWRTRTGDAEMDTALLVLAQADPGSRGSLDLSLWG